VDVVPARRRRPTRVRTRLVALVLVPALGLALFGGFEAYERAVTASRAREVEQRVGRASDLLELRLALADEAFASGSLATGRQFGLTPDGMSSLFGTDLVARTARDRRTVTQLEFRLRDERRLAPAFRRLRDVRAHLEANPGDVAALLAGMSQVQSDVTNASNDALQQADDVSFGDVSSVALRRDLTVLRRADQAAIGVGVQLDALGQLLAPRRRRTGRRRSPSSARGSASCTRRKTGSRTSRPRRSVRAGTRRPPMPPRSGPRRRPSVSPRWHRARSRPSISAASRRSSPTG
jgi:hypothetical protein